MFNIKKINKINNNEYCVHVIDTNSLIVLPAKAILENDTWHIDFDNANIDYTHFSEGNISYVWDITHSNKSKSALSELLLENINKD